MAIDVGGSRVKFMTDKVRRGANTSAFEGGFRLWKKGAGRQTAQRTPIENAAVLAASGATLT